MRWYTPIAALLAVVASNMAFAKVQLIDQVVALVNEGVVLESEVSRRITVVQTQIKEPITEDEALEQLKLQVLDQLINESIQLQMAMQQGVRVDDNQLNQALAKVAQQQGATLAQFKDGLEQSGHNYLLFREDIRKDLIMNQFRDAQMARRIFVSEQEIAATLKQLNSSQESQLSYHIGHIMLALSEDADAQAVSKANEKALKIRESIQSNADFEKLALTSSEDHKALSGGDLGWLTIPEMPLVFAEAVKANPGLDTIGPVRSRNGLHILRILDKQGEQKQFIEKTSSRHILIKPSEILPDESAFLKLSNIRKSIVDGEVAFDAAAKVHSEDFVSAEQGGDLGWAVKGQFDPAFEKELYSLKPNEISEPFKSSFGWHIVQMLEKKEFDETEAIKRSNAIRMIRARKFDETLQSWIQELRDTAYVKILSKEYQKLH